MTHPAAQRPPEPAWQLIYRYLWPFQYFRDVTRGTRLERQQNYRHNRSMRVHLPGFALKWSALTGFWFAVGGFFEHALALIIPAACFFLTATGTLVMTVLMVVSWIWLERFPELY